MDIRRNGSQPSSLGGAENFTGHARRDPILTAPGPSRLVAGQVAFAPGARTVWHTHPVGQLLIVTGGLGRACTWGGEVQEIGAGDAVWFPPGEKHWHGAGPTTGMTHIAIVETQDGSGVTWMEAVTDDQYKG